jgi:hypothetical protein
MELNNQTINKHVFDYLVRFRNIVDVVFGIAAEFCQDVTRPVWHRLAPLRPVFIVNRRTWF